MANQGNKSQSGSAGSSSDERNRDRNREQGSQFGNNPNSPSNPNNPTQGDGHRSSPTKPGTGSGGMDQGDRSTPDDRAERGMRETDAD